MNVPVITPELIESFILVLIRVSAMMLMLPVFGNKAVPMQVKWGLSLFITLLLFPLVRQRIAPAGNLETLPLALDLAKEILIGIIIGFSVQLMFAGIQLAGEMMGFQMGFAVANVIDPNLNSQVSVISEFYYLMSLMLFLTFNAHHLFITAMAESYDLIPFGAVQISGNLFQVILAFAKGMFAIAVKISAPIMAVLLFSNVAMGVVARTVPQMNVFIVSFPLHISLGLIFIGLSAPVFVRMVERLLSVQGGEVYQLLRMMGP